MHDPDKLETLRDMWREAQETATDAVHILGTLTHKLIQAQAAAGQHQPHTPRLVVPPDLQRILDDAPGPAYLINRYYTVRAANALSYRLDGRSVVGRNSAWIGFEAARRGCIAQEHSLEYTVAGLRAQLDDHPEDPELHLLIRDLGRRFPQFAALWDRRQVRIGGCVIARPSPNGELVFDYECQPVPVPGTDLRFAVGIPRRGTRTRERLNRIADQDNESPLSPPRSRAVA